MVKVARFSRESIASSANMGLKFHKHIPAYVATGGSSRTEQTFRNGMEIEAGMR